MNSAEKVRRNDSQLYQPLNLADTARGFRCTSPRPAVCDSECPARPPRDGEGRRRSGRSPASRPRAAAWPRSARARRCRTERLKSSGGSPAAANGHRQGQFADPLRLPPMGQIAEHIGPQQEKELARRVLLAKMGQGVGRIIHAAAVRFIAADGKRRMPANGQLQHFDSILCRRQFPLLLMGRNRSRQEPAPRPVGPVRGNIPPAANGRNGRDRSCRRRFLCASLISRWKMGWIESMQRNPSESEEWKFEISDSIFEI